MVAASGAPTMADVAQRAGVSHQTVSRVLNDSPAVRPETREAVLRAVDELGYRRNSAARALVTRRSGLIGVLVDELHLYGPASAVVSIATAAREAGYGITLDPLWVVTGSTLKAAFDHQLAQSVEAVVLVAAHGEDPGDALRGVDVPVVALDGYLPDRPWIGVDQYTGARMATRHLLDLGHRRVVHVSGPRDWPQSQARERGYRESLEEVGAGPGTVIGGDWSARSGYEAGRVIAEEHPGTTAVFVSNDQMALGVIRALSEAGLAVPQDISVVGFDDIPESAYAQPPLTTVRQDFGALGAEAVRLAVAAIRGEETESALIPPLLVPRASTARPPRAARGAQAGGRRPSRPEVTAR